MAGSITVTTLDFGSLPVGDNYTVPTLTPSADSSIPNWYDLEHAFMGAVQPTPFTMKSMVDLFNGIKKGAPSPLSYLTQPEVLGLLVLLTIGVIYIIVLFFSCIIFPSYRFCCMKGQQHYNPDGRKSKRKVMTVVITVCSIIIIFAVVIMYITSCELVQSLQNTQDIVDAALSDLKTAVTNAIGQTDYVIKEASAVMFYKVQSELLNVGGVITSIITAKLAADKGLNLQSITDLKNTVTNLRAAMNNVTQQFTTLKTMVTALNTKITNLQTTQQQLITADNCVTPQCIAAAQSVPALPSITMDLSAQITQMDSIVTLVTSMDPLQMIGTAVKSAAVTSVTSGAQVKMAGLIPQINEYIYPLYDNLNQIGNILDSFRGTARGYTQYPKQYGPAMSYGFIGLATFFGLIVGLAIVGMLTGYYKYEKGKLPTERDGMVVVGGRCLIISVYLIIIFSWLWMLVTVILMLVATQVDEIVCPILQGESDNFKLLGDSVMEINKNVMKLGFFDISPTATIDPALVITMCMNDIPVYTAFMLNSVFDLKGIQQQLTDTKLKEQMASLNVDLTGVTLMSPATKTSIDTAVAVTAFDFTAVLLALKSIAAPAGGFTAIGQLDRATAATMTSSANANSMKTTASSWDALDTADMSTLLAQRDAVVVSISALDAGLKSLPTVKDAVMVTATAAQVMFSKPSTDPTGVSGLIVASTIDYGNRIMDYVQQYVTYVTEAVEHEIGTCRPIYDAFHAISSLLCTGIIRPINGLWFSIGLVLILFIPIIFLNTYLSAYYSKAKELAPLTEAEMLAMNLGEGEEGVGKGPIVVITPDS